MFTVTGSTIFYKGMKHFCNCYQDNVERTKELFLLDEGLILETGPAVCLTNVDGNQILTECSPTVLVGLYVRGFWIAQ